jgi:hypothetical protein
MANRRAVKQANILFSICESAFDIITSLNHVHTLQQEYWVKDGAIEDRDKFTLHLDSCDNCRGENMHEENDGSSKLATSTCTTKKP